METKKIVMGVISVAVAIIVLMSMIPIFTDAGASEDTFTNEGYFYLDKFTDSYTFSWDHDDPDVFVINGEEVKYPADTGSLQVSLFLTDTCAMRYVNSTLVLNFYGGGTFVAGNDTYTQVTATLEDGTLTVTNGTTTKAMSNISEIYSIVNTGPYVMKDKDKVAYLNEDSEIYGAGLTYSGNVYLFANFKGTIDDLTFGPSNVTFSDVVITSSENADHKDLYELSNIKFKATLNATEYNPTYSYFVVPAEVTAERSAHASPVEATLIGLIPLLMMVGIMLTAVGLFIAKYRKN